MNDRKGEVRLDIRYNKHRHRSNNIVVAAMFEMYRGKKSLREIAATYRYKSSSSISDLFHSRGYQLRSKQFKGLTIIDGHQLTLAQHGHLYGTVRHQRIAAHRYVWQKYHGPVPADCVIHHRDGDPANNDPANLELILKKEMPRRFNPERRNQYSKIKSC